MQESLLLILQLKRNQEAGPLHQVVPVILCSTFYNRLIVFELVSLQDVSTDIIFKRVIIYTFLLALSVVLNRTHSIARHRSFINRSERLKRRLHTLIVILLIATVDLAVAKFVFGHAALRCTILPISTRV